MPDPHDTPQMELTAALRMTKAALDRWDHARGKGGYPTGMERCAMRTVLDFAARRAVERDGEGRGGLKVTGPTPPAERASEGEGA